MQDVPFRRRLIVSPIAGIVVPEPVNDRVPDGLISADQSGFHGTDQITFGIGEEHVTADEMITDKVISSLNGYGVLS